MLIVLLALAGAATLAWAGPPRAGGASAAPTRPTPRTGGTPATTDVRRTSANNLRQPVTPQQTSSPRSHPTAAAGARAPGNATTAAPQSHLFKINARLYLTDKSAQREGRRGWSQLRWSETNLAAALEYKDYHLLRLEDAQVTQNTACQVRLRRHGTVSIVPLYKAGDRITARITWEVPGNDAWQTDVELVPGRRSMVGSPATFDGDAYLLSVTVR